MPPAFRSQDVEPLTVSQAEHMIDILLTKGRAMGVMGDLSPASLAGLFVAAGWVTLHEAGLDQADIRAALDGVLDALEGDNRVGAA